MRRGVVVNRRERLARSVWKGPKQRERSRLNMASRADQVLRGGCREHGKKGRVGGGRGESTLQRGRVREGSGLGGGNALGWRGLGWEAG